jgi:hypothetical protein
LSTERPAQSEQAGRASSSDQGRRALVPEADGANDQRDCQQPRPHPRSCPRISSSTDGEAEPRYLIGPQPASEDLLPPRARTLDWAALLKRVYDVDVLHCPRCAGRLEVIAAISERSVVTKILAHLGLPTSLPQPAPARAPPWAELEFDHDLDDNKLCC